MIFFCSSVNSVTCSPLIKFGTSRLKFFYCIENHLCRFICICFIPTIFLLSTNIVCIKMVFNRINKSIVMCHNRKGNSKSPHGKFKNRNHHNLGTWIHCDSNASFQKFYILGILHHILGLELMHFGEAQRGCQLEICCLYEKCVP